MDIEIITEYTLPEDVDINKLPEDAGGKYILIVPNANEPKMYKYYVI